MKVKNINGVKTAIINMFIDPENGFLNPLLKDDRGGALYVPEGEKTSGLMGDIIAQSTGSTFILGQDYHPANHMSFMVNHPGVMEYRVGKFKEFLAANGQEIPEGDALYEAAQQPVHFFTEGEPPVPFHFPELVMDQNRNFIGFKEEDGRVRKVQVKTSSGQAPSEKDRGRVSKVTNEYFDKSFDEMRAEGQLLSTQTLWTKHCVQGTESSLYPADMNLPKELKEKLEGDLLSRVIHHHDAKTGNDFYVIRKGVDSEVDSYGIGVENDGETMTGAWDVFKEIAQELKKQGVENVVINGGGLASNFCVEFSLNNTADFLAGHFKMRGMDVEVNFVPEISRGIPIPGGPDVPFSLDGVEERLKQSRGIGTKSLNEVLAMSAPEKKAQNGASRKFPGLAG